MVFVTEHNSVLSRLGRLPDPGQPAYVAPPLVAMAYLDFRFAGAAPSGTHSCNENDCTKAAPNSPRLILTS